MPGGLSSGTSVAIKGVCREIGKLQQIVVKSQTREKQTITYPCVVYSTKDTAIPPYTHYVSTKRNLLVEDELNSTFIPYHGDDTWLNEDGDVDMEDQIERNQKKYHELNQLREKAELHGSMAERFLEDIDCTFDDILHYFLNETNPVVPTSLPSHLVPVWLNRESHIQNDYYDDSEDYDSPQSSTGDSIRGDKKRMSQWDAVYEAITPSPNDQRLAVAGIASAVFLKVTGFSLWHIAKRQRSVLEIIGRFKRLQVHPDEAQADCNPPTSRNTSAITYLELGCSICFAYDTYLLTVSG